MTAHRNILDIELRLRPNGSPAAWEAMLAALMDWNAQLVPTHVDRLSDLDAGEAPEPWTAVLAARLAQRCAKGGHFAWELMREDDDDVGLSVSGRAHEIQLSLALADPPSDLRDYFFGLLRVLPPARQPALAMLFDRYSDDAECVMQGLRGVSIVPPMLYLDAQAIATAGGAAHLRAAPCRIADGPAGGILLVMRASIWKHPSASDRKTIVAVAQHLGITPANPLVLIGD
jgi:hypothetical protein